MHLLPFEKLLDSLRLQGFSLGVEAHLRVNELLNEGEIVSLDELKVQLGALLARDLKEQESFYRAFEAFVVAHSYVPPKKIEDKNRQNLFVWLLVVISLLALMGIGYSLYQANTGVDAGFEYYQSAYTFKTWIRDTSRVKQLRFFGIDSIQNRRFELEGTEVYEGKEVISFEPPEAGRYTVELEVKSRRGKDRETHAIYTLYYLDPQLRILDSTSKTVDFRLRIESRIRPIPSKELQNIVEKADSIFWKQNTVIDSIEIDFVGGRVPTGGRSQR